MDNKQDYLNRCIKGCDGLHGRCAVVGCGEPGCYVREDAELCALHVRVADSLDIVNSPDHPAWDSVVDSVYRAVQGVKP